MFGRETPVELDFLQVKRIWSDANPRMNANETNSKIIYPELSYAICGFLFKVHNDLGRFCRERQYGDALEKLLSGSSLEFEREKELPLLPIDNQRTNIVDFSIGDKILVDLKAKPMIVKEDYYQMQRYLQSSGYKLGLIVNFRNRYLKPMRVIKTNS